MEKGPHKASTEKHTDMGKYPIFHNNSNFNKFSTLNYSNNSTNQNSHRNPTESKKEKEQNPQKSGVFTIPQEPPTTTIKETINLPVLHNKVFNILFPPYLQRDYLWHRGELPLMAKGPREVTPLLWSKIFFAQLAWKPPPLRLPSWVSPI